MSQSKDNKKTAMKKGVDNTLKATTSSLNKGDSTSSQFLFGRKNFMFMFIGLGLIALGMLLMSGGSMPSPDVWDEDIIYSTRRTLIAPIVILAGLAMQIYAIFVKK